MNWDECVSKHSSGHSDDEPGMPHLLTIRMPEAGSEHYFAIQAVDVAGNRSPITFLETPVRSSSDNDGDHMEDGWEAANALDPTTDDSREDGDGDGLANLQEYENGLEPDDPDTDGDGYSDGDETRFGGNPRWGFGVPCERGSRMGS